MFLKLRGSILTTMRRGFRAIRRSIPAAEAARSAPSFAGRFVLASYTNCSGTRAYKTYILHATRGSCGRS